MKTKITLLFLLFFLSYSHARADNWVDWHGTGSTAGVDTGVRYNPVSGLTPPFSLLWSHNNWDGAGMNVIQESSPVIVNGIVYVGSGAFNLTGVSHILYAWNAATGAAVPGYPVNIPGNAVSSPAVVNGVVYIGTTENNLYAFNAATGAAMPGFPAVAGGWMVSSPAVVNGIVYAGSQDTMLYAWDAATGAVIPGFPVSTMGPIWTSPAVANGIVYAASWDDYLYAWDAATGAAIAGFPVYLGAGMANVSSPSVANGIVYVGSFDGNLYAFNAATGAAIAGFPVSAGGSVFSTPAVANGVVYIGSQNGKFYAFDAATGAAIPGFPVGLNDEIDSSAAIANGYAYIGDQSNTVYAIKLATGSIDWQYTFPSNYGAEGVDLCAPAVADDKLFVTTDQGNGIYVFQNTLYSPTPTGTVTRTPVVTPTFTITGTPPTATISPTWTCTPQVTPTFTATPSPTFYPAGDINIYPNPFNPDTANNGVLKITNLPIGADICIYTLSGEFVNSFKAQQPVVYWNGKNLYHYKVSQGIYYYLIKWDNEKEKRIGKIFVIH